MFVASSRRAGTFSQCVVFLLVCLLCLPVPALAQDIVWNGPGTTGNTGELRTEPGGGRAGSLYPDAPSNNIVTVNGEVPGNVSGGIDYQTSGSAVSTGNRVTVNNTKLGWGVSGGDATSGSGSAMASGNSVTINDSSVVHVWGARSTASDSASPATASGNSVTINGGKVQGNVRGGMGYGASGSATDNTVTFSGSLIFSSTSEIWGGFVTSDGSNPLPAADAFAGNTLNLWNYTGNAVKSVQNFQYYNFILPASLQTFTANTVTLGNGAGTDSTVTGVNIMGGGNAPRVGDVLTLVQAGTLTGAIDNGGAVISGRKGISLLYDFQLNRTANALTATVLSESLNPQTKALSEGRAAGMAFVNQGADLGAGPGMFAAGNGGYGLSAFSAFQAGTSRYDSGSHVDVDGFSLMTGLAWNRPTDYGKLLLGAFFEAGWGNYDSHNSFSGYASVKGDGDTEYYGGGVLGRFDFAPTGPGNIYTEASIRAGWAETDFSSSDLRDGIGQKADYESGAAYYGAHLGLGYIWNISDASSLDLYTKYFWTHQDSDSVTITGDPVKFKSADSHRWRGGARFSYTLNSEGGLSFTPYVGAAYEHEFDGEAKATAYGYSIDAPDLKGSTGIGELGLSFKPSTTSGLSLDLGVQGYTGVREGVTGSLQIKFEF